MVRKLEDLLDGKRVAKLKPLAITDVVDLVGALEADHASVGHLLGLNPEEVDTLHARALSGLPADVRTSFSRHRSQPPGMGAWDPGEP